VSDLPESYQTMNILDRLKKTSKFDSKSFLIVIFIIQSIFVFGITSVLGYYRKQPDSVISEVGYTFDSEVLDHSIRVLFDLDENDIIRKQLLVTIEQIGITDNNVLLNGESVYTIPDNETIIFTNLDYLSSVTSISIDTNREFRFDLTKPNESITSLSISKANLIDQLNTVSQLRNLVKINITNTNLVNLDEIATISTLESLHLHSNQIRSLEPLRDKYYQYINLFNNPIWDFRPIHNVTSINIWDQSHTAYNFNNLPNASARNSVSRQIQVIVGQLRTRSEPSSEAEMLGHMPKGFYTILGESWDNAGNFNWYRVADNCWISGNEGNWTIIHE